MRVSDVLVDRDPVEPIDKIPEFFDIERDNP
jgi:hypothetical protein